jgi:hypothetical protein
MDKNLTSDDFNALTIDETFSAPVFDIFLCIVKFI